MDGAVRAARRFRRGGAPNWLAKAALYERVTRQGGIGRSVPRPGPASGEGCVIWTLSGALIGEVCSMGVAWAVLSSHLPPANGASSVSGRLSAANASTTFRQSAGFSRWSEPSCERWSCLSPVSAAWLLQPCNNLMRPAHHRPHPSRGAAGTSGARSLFDRASASSC